MSRAARLLQLLEHLRTHRRPLLAVWGRNDPFFLPAGAFATSVVRELMQAEEADHGFRNSTDANSGQ